MPRALSVDELLELGQTYYGRQDLEKALNAFRQAAQLTPTPKLDALDGCAAVHDKMGNHQSSLQDGRTMIKLYKADPRGYIRVGKALQKLNKVARAREIYSYGLKNVSPSDKKYKLLETFLARVQREIAPPKPVDLLSILPLELAQEILEYLTFRERVICLRVSKGWRNFIKSLTPLWTTIDFSQARRMVRHATVIEYIKCARTKPRHMILNRLSEQWRTLARLTSCRDLVSIELQGAWGSLEEMPDLPANLKTFIAGAGIEVKMADAMSVLTKRAATLKHAEFRGLTKTGTTDWSPPDVDLPHLETLVFCRPHLRTHYRILAESRAIKAVWNRATNLKHIVLRWDSPITDDFLDLQAFPRLETLDVQAPVLGTFSIDHLPASLRSLRLPAITSPRSEEDHVNARGSSLPNLEDLGITDCAMFDWVVADMNVLLYRRQTLEDGLHTPRRIKSLSLDCSVMLTEWHDILRPLLDGGGCFDLEELTLANMGFYDDFIVPVIQRHRNLRRLSIPGSQVTGVAVKEAVVTPKSQLEFLGLENCWRVSNDAVEWARERGVHVVAPNLAKLEKSGRKVRHGG